MALYSSFLSVGAATGLIFSGIITINHHWRVIFQVASALIGTVLLVAFFAFPETAYTRETPSQNTADSDSISSKPPSASEKAHPASSTAPTDIERTSQAVIIPRKRPYISSLKIFHGTLTNESFLKLVVRPLGLIILPPVLWAALVEAATIGFLVAMTSNVEIAYEATYKFKSWQVGLCFIAALLGSIAGIPVGGKFADVVADYFTKRNGGVRDPEMRLPAMIPALITAPLSLVLFGVGIEYKLHWMCPTMGIALRKFCSPSLL